MWLRLPGLLLLTTLAACAAPAPSIGAASSRATPATTTAVTACGRELREAEEERKEGFWLRAARRLEGALAQCPTAREDHEAALAELVIALDDLNAAERLAANLAAPQRARLVAWLEQKRAEPSLDVSDELHAVRALRAQHAEMALAAAESALARNPRSGELLAEIGLLRLASHGHRDAQPYFDRARVALERATGQKPEAFVLQSELGAFTEVTGTPDARELWLWGRAQPTAFSSDRERERTWVPVAAVVFDAETFEPVWRLLSDSSSCPAVPLAQGAGFVRCDGVFARNGRRTHPLPEVLSATQVPFAVLRGVPRLLFAEKNDERSARLSWLEPVSGAIEPLPMPPIDELVGLGASPTGEWFFVESAAGVDVFAYPSLKRLMRVKAHAPQALDSERIAFVSAAGELEIWQLRPQRRLARRGLPAVLIPHGPIIGSDYFRSGNPERVWFQHLGSEWSWAWREDPSIPPALTFPTTADEIPGQSLRDVAVASDGRWSAELRRDDRLEFDELRIDSSDHAVLATPSAVSIQNFAVSPDGRHMALNLANKTLALIDLEAGKVSGTLDFVHISRVAAYDNTHMVLELPRETWLLDARDGTHQPLASSPYERFFAGGSSGVFVTTGWRGHAVSYDAEGNVLQSFGLEPGALSPSGAWVLLKDKDRLALASTRLGTRALLLDVEPDLERWRFSLDERRVATLGPFGLVVWDTASDKKWRVAPRSKFGRVTSLEFAANDDVVVLAQSDAPAIAFRYATGESVPPPELVFLGANALAWAQSSRSVTAFRRADGAARLTLIADGTRGFVVRSADAIDFIGAEPAIEPRCAFGNVLVAWPVCGDTLRVPGLLKRLLHDGESAPH